MKLAGLIAGVLLFSACARTTSRDSDPQYDHAVELARRFIITDGHVDLPERLQELHYLSTSDTREIVLNDKQGNFDFNKAVAGGLDAPFMSVYIPSSRQLNPDRGAGLADSLIDMVHHIAETSPTMFALATSPAQVRANSAASKVSLPIGIENAAPIGDDLSKIKYYFDRGIRYATLTHAKNNQICDSSYDSIPTWNGLSPFGEKVVTEMNRVGMMVDISHVTDSTFYDVLRVTRTPVIASHSSCRYFTPGWQRNMSDEMIKALARNGGVINISFGANFLDSTAAANKAIREKLTKELKDLHLTSADHEAREIIDRYTKDAASLFSTVERVADHIDHVVKIAGVDHVGFGSDFDGVGDSLPLELKDVSMYPNLIYVLIKRGYGDSDIEKICGGNMLRVWQQVLDAAEK